MHERILSTEPTCMCAQLECPHVGRRRAQKEQHSGYCRLVVVPQRKPAKSIYFRIKQTEETLKITANKRIYVLYMSGIHVFELCLMCIVYSCGSRFVAKLLLLDFGYVHRSSHLLC